MNDRLLSSAGDLLQCPSSDLQPPGAESFWHLLTSLIMRKVDRITAQPGIPVGWRHSAAPLHAKDRR
jgi:hypothetical protein